MKSHHLPLLLFTLFLSVPAWAGEAGPGDPESWYRADYAPLWNDAPADHLDEILAYYALQVVSHNADGVIERANSRDWLGGALEEWSAEDWLRSELTDLRTDRINATTVAFKARWVDRYRSGPEETSCGWYLANWQEGAWRFTAYADLECAAHDL